MRLKLPPREMPNTADADHALFDKSWLIFFLQGMWCRARAGRRGESMIKLVRFVLAASAVPLLGIGALFPFSDARASGFALNEMSAAGVGNAHAGGAAAAEDLSTIYFNPAGLTRLPGRQFMAVGSLIQTSVKFENRRSISAAGTPLTGGNGGDGGAWSPVPALYYAMDLRPRLRFGIGVQAPFGLKTDYDANWAGRYQALKSELTSININPSLAYQLNDRVSLGAGISAQYVDVELSRAIDFGSACVGTLGATPCASSGFLPQARDGRAKVDGTDWGFGFNLGAMYTLDAKTRFGIAYRSKISHEITGDASFSKPAGLPAPLAASRAFTNTGARASVDLPESLNVSGYVELDPKWSVMADINWMHWSRFKELRVRFDNGAPDSVTPENWRNTVRLAVAANYRYNDMWKLRGGIAYDPTPVRDEFRTPRIPDDDRTWLTFGAQYKPTRNATWDFGYAHLFVKDSSIDKTDPPLGGRLIGDYKNYVNILSVQYRQAF
jgi:long-chain fatty acid transport protein